MFRTKPGFTLVEILIVVVILGIIAGIIVPSFSDVTTVSRESNLKENLSKIRAQIQVYRAQHGDWPDGASFTDQMLKYTNFQGQVADQRSAEFHYGPYLEQMPVNPVSGDNAVRSSNDPAQYYPPGDADGGWWYNETTGRFYADLTGIHTDTHGGAYNRY